MSSRCLLAAVVLLCALALPASAQTKLAVSITDVTVKQLTNGLRITLKADGLLEVRTNGQWWETNSDHEFTLWLGNALSAVGTFVDVSRYPVNYLKFDTPADAREGVGVNLTVRFFRYAHVRSIEVDNEDTDWTWDWDPGETAYDIRKGRSGNELIITVWSDRREILPEDHKARYEQDLPHEFSLEVLNGHVNVDALNVPLQELMEKLSEQTGVSVYISDRVERLVTLRLHNIAVERFVQVVSESLGLTCGLQEDGWYISDGLPSSLAPYTAGDSRRIALDYISAKAAVSILPEFLLSYLRPSPTDDAIIAHGPARLLDRIESDVRLLDKPRRAVRLHAAMVEASTTRARRLMWSVLREGSPTVDIDGARGEISIVREDRSQENLLARLQALAETEEVSVTVRPSVLVEEGRSASIFSGVKQFFQFLSGGDTIALDSTEAGVTVYVQPLVVGEEVVQAYVSLDISTIRCNRQPPIVDSREASATLMLASDDSMIVAGGLLDRGRQQDRDGLAPLAPAVPGRAGSSDETREIVFLIGADVVPARSSGAGDELALKGEG